MSERWREIEQIAHNMKKLADNRNLPYSEQEKLRREARTLEDEARKQRQAYVNWLWGY